MQILLFVSYHVERKVHCVNIVSCSPLSVQHWVIWWFSWSAPSPVVDLLGQTGWADSGWHHAAPQDGHHQCVLHSQCTGNAYWYVMDSLYLSRWNRSGQKPFGHTCIHVIPKETIRWLGLVLMSPVVVVIFTRCHALLPVLKDNYYYMYIPPLGAH